MFVIGLTGGIASGKSTVAGFLTARGANLLDADKTGHKVLFLPQVKQDLRETFGDDIFDEQGEVVRPKLGAKVFGNPDNLAKLNAISHPRLRELLVDELEAARANPDIQVTVFDAAILIEAGWTTMCDEIWVVYVPEDTAVERLMSRNNLTEEQARARIASQMPIEEKRSHADVVIPNDAALEATQQTIDAEWAKLMARVRGEEPRLRPAPPGVFER